MERQDSGEWWGEKGTGEEVTGGSWSWFLIVLINSLERERPGQRQREWRGGERWENLEGKALGPRGG